jgi:hypothetical protein
MSDLSILGAPVFRHAYVLVPPLWIHHDKGALLSAYAPRALREYILNQMFGRDYMRFSEEVMRCLFVRCITVSYVYPPIHLGHSLFAPVCAALDGSVPT